MSKNKCKANQVPIRYATVADFFEIFNDEMHSLFLLSILLTADIEKAEKCFVEGLQECMHGMDVFMEWARLWARRTIIKHAIRQIMPVQGRNQGLPSTIHKWLAAPETDNLIGSIFALDTFERFVFVMSLIERQSDQDCAFLLNCRRRDIQSARSLALKNISSTNNCSNPGKEAMEAWQNIWLRHGLQTSA